MQGTAFNFTCIKLHNTFTCIALHSTLPVHHVSHSIQLYQYCTALNFILVSHCIQLYRCRTAQCIELYLYHAAYNYLYHTVYILPVNLLLTRTTWAIPVVNSSSRSIGARYRRLRKLRLCVSNMSGKWQ